MAKDNIIVESESINSTSLVLSPSTPADSLQYSWQIIQDWYASGKPITVNGLFSDSTRSNPSFRAPSKIGPYRVFITVFNSMGYCANANIPIYVVK